LKALLKSAIYGLTLDLKSLLNRVIYGLSWKELVEEGKFNGLTLELKSFVWPHLGPDELFDVGHVRPHLRLKELVKEGHVALYHRVFALEPEHFFHREKEYREKSGDRPPPIHFLSSAASVCIYKSACLQLYPKTRETNSLCYASPVVLQ
jgi:hypothetical protein